MKIFDGVDCMIKQFIKNRRTVLAVYFMLLISIVFCGGYLYNVHHMLSDKFQEDVETVLQRKSESINKELQSGYRMLKERSNFMQANKIKSIYWQDYLKSFSDYETYERISIADLSGNAVSSDGFTYNIAHEKYFNDSVQGKTSVSEVFIDPVTKEEVFVLSMPLKVGNQIDGVLTMTKKVTVLKRVFIDNFYSGDLSWLIIDNQGNVIVDSKSQQNDYKFKNLFDELKKTPQDEFSVERIRAMVNDKTVLKNNNVVKVKFFDQKVYLGFIKMNADGENWNLISMVGEDAVMKKSQDLISEAFVMCASVIVILVIMAIYIAYMRENNRRGIEDLAYMDSLTRIGNFNSFQTRVASLLAKHPDLDYAIICIDIRNFKYINEMYGYVEGDRVLIDFANILRENFSGDEVCARMSGDKFILLYKVDDEEFTRIHKILDNFINDQGKYSIKAPIVFTSGAYRVPYENRRKIQLVDLTVQPYQAYSHYENIISMVDKANLARTAIRNSDNLSFRCYDDSLMKCFVEENEITALMKKALEDREFKVYLQPKYDLKSLEIVGAEALVRWISQEKGFMNPDMFIGIFEKNGFIIELDFYVLEEVCKKIRYWLDNDILPVPISVNQSRIHMNNPLYIDRLSSVLKRYGIPAKFIELELTETMFFDNTQRLVDIISQMRALGLAISMDDFGSGYSSLNLLKELPVDTLKLDKTFLYETENSSRSKIIIEQVVEMARKLGMMTICEGVEIKEQADFLRDIDCDIAQGFLYARPMPIEEFDKFRERM